MEKVPPFVALVNTKNKSCWVIIFQKQILSGDVICEEVLVTMKDIELSI